VANVKITWMRNEYPVRLGEVAKEFGVDIATLADYANPFEAFPWLESKVRFRILENIADEWNENKLEGMREFSEVRKGVYVITLASNISIDYSGKPSQVLYIGRGALKQRFSEHLKRWIPAITKSIYDFGLIFWMTEIRKAGSGDLFKEVESDLLVEFKDEYGRVPLQNKIRGKINEKLHSYENGWKKPFWKNKKLKSGWAIRPLEKNPWKMTLDEE